MVKMIAVISSMVVSIGYDDSCSELYVQFKNGDVYKYIDVPLSVFNAAIEADSVGSYIDKNIKKKNYRYQKVS